MNMIHTQDGAVDVFKRDWVEAFGVTRLEIDANIFAAELLVPSEHLHIRATKLGANGIDLADDAIITRLADDFVVPKQVIAVKLYRLGYLQV